ncbi:MAG: sodium:calcium antiporter [Acidobacteriota bacterium]|nr:sodium:calcium antiporter [Acidobacteriota bacterium]
MASSPVALVLLVFAAASGATWVAGVQLSRTTDDLDRRLGLGDAIGGMVLLAVAGSLPELAITISAARSGHLGLAAGNLIGGIATATMVLVICDLFAPRPLTFLVGSLVPVLEGMLVVLTVAVVLMGALLPRSEAIAGRVSPASLAIVLIWVGGVWVLNRTRSSPKWEVVMAGSQPGRPHRRIPHPVADAARAGRSTARVAGVFGLSAVVTLIAGVALEISGNELATRAGINGVVFGATFLAIATALPEISSGIEAVRLGDHQLAIGDVFGGNAFQLCLFVVADLVAGKPVLPTTGSANAWLAGLGLVLTTVYIGGVIVRPSRPNRIGPESIMALVVYAVGVLGLLRVVG